MTFRSRAAVVLITGLVPFAWVLWWRYQRGKDGLEVVLANAVAVLLGLGSAWVVAVAAGLWGSRRWAPWAARATFVLVIAGALVALAQSAPGTTAGDLVGPAVLVVVSAVILGLLGWSEGAG